MAYQADGTQDDLRLPDERDDIERSPGRFSGTVSATAVHRATVRVHLYEVTRRRAMFMSPIENSIPRRSRCGCRIQD